MTTQLKLDVLDHLAVKSRLLIQFKDSPAEYVGGLFIYVDRLFYGDLECQIGASEKSSN